MTTKITTAICCAAIFLGGLIAGRAATPQSDVKLDGPTWRTLNTNEKTRYAQGWIQGYQDATDAAQLITEGKPGGLSATTRDFFERQKRDVSRSFDRRTDAAAVAKTIDTFYGDFRNQPVCWDVAVAFSVMALQGDSASADEQHLAVFRKVGCSSSQP